MSIKHKSNYEWIWLDGGTCYLCGRAYPHWSYGDNKRIGLVRLRKKNHMTRPILVCRTCLRRFAFIAAELEVFDKNQDLISEEEIEDDDELEDEI
ncbi:hypothetical protein EU528_12320 [Candidatus Thorarchaeota archaeon]|nr:MAG: hypothetical protein EU528_12320 [Candidatus Thorarchaeota archaeon]